MPKTTEGDTATAVKATRAPKCTKEHKLELQRTLPQFAPTHGEGGLSKVLADCFAPGKESTQAVERIAALLSLEAAKWLRAKMLHLKATQNLKPVPVLPSTKNMTPAERKEAVEAAQAQERMHVADGVRDEINRATATKPPSMHSNSPAATVAAGGTKGSALGTSSSFQEDAPNASTVWDGVQRTLPTFEPPDRVILADAAHMIPRRRDVYIPTEAQQKAQLKKVKSWKLERLLFGRREDENFYFSMKAASKAILKARKEFPSLETLEKFCHFKVLPALTGQFSGHLWSGRDLAPFDPGQCAAYAGTPDLAEGLYGLVALYKLSDGKEGLTESQVRQVTGQGTVYGAIKVVMDRIYDTLGPKGKLWLKGTKTITIGSSGSGINFTAYQLMKWWGARTPNEIKWNAESDEKVAKAAAIIDKNMGQQPEHFERAEDERLATKTMKVGVETATLSCCPFAFEGKGKDADAIIAETARWAQSFAARGSSIAIYENSAALIERHKESYQRILMIFERLEAYQTELIITSSERHAQEGLHRSRVFIVCKKKEKWLTSDRTESKEEGCEPAEAGQGKASSVGSSSTDRLKLGSKQEKKKVEKGEATAPAQRLSQEVMKSPTAGVKRKAPETAVEQAERARSNLAANRAKAKAKAAVRAQANQVEVRKKIAAEESAAKKRKRAVEARGKKRIRNALAEAGLGLRKPGELLLPEARVYTLALAPAPADAPAEAGDAAPSLDGPALNPLWRKGPPKALHIILEEEARVGTMQDALDTLLLEIYTALVHKEVKEQLYDIYECIDIESVMKATSDPQPGTNKVPWDATCLVGFCSTYENLVPGAYSKAEVIERFLMDAEHADDKKKVQWSSGEQASASEEVANEEEAGIEEAETQEVVHATRRTRGATGRTAAAVPDHALVLLEKSTGRGPFMMTEVPAEQSYVAVWWSPADQRVAAERLHSITGLPRLVFLTQSRIGTYVFYAWTGTAWNPHWVATQSARSRASKEPTEAYALYAIKGGHLELNRIDVMKLQGEAIGEPERHWTKAFLEQAGLVKSENIWVKGDKEGKACIMEHKEARDDWSRFIGHAKKGEANLIRGPEGEVLFTAGKARSPPEGTESWEALAKYELTINRGLDMMPSRAAHMYQYTLAVQKDGAKTPGSGMMYQHVQYDMEGHATLQELNVPSTQEAMSQILLGDVYGMGGPKVSAQLYSAELASTRAITGRNDRIILSISERKVFEELARIIGADPIVMEAIGRMLEGGAKEAQLIGIHQIIPKVGPQAITRADEANATAKERVCIHLQDLHQDEPGKGDIAQIALDVHGDALATWIDPCGGMDRGHPMASPALQQISGSMGIFDLGVMHGAAALTMRQARRAKGYSTHAGNGYLTGRFFIEIGKPGMDSARIEKFQHQYLKCTTAKTSKLPVALIQSGSQA